VTSVPRREAAANVPVGKPPARPSHRRDLRPVVLLVDDSAEYRDLYAVLLEQTATVITASRGEDALVIATTQPLDAIVLDVMMPGMDGWQTCERLKANPITRAIPVVMLTSLDGRDVPATAARVGAASVLIKPCPVERLAAAIHVAIRQP
jgi:two-component system cell cycle response regulator